METWIHVYKARQPCRGLKTPGDPHSGALSGAGDAKRAAARAVIEIVEGCRGCTIAVGSGSTVKIFIEEMKKRGLIEFFTFVSTSIDTTQALRSAGARSVETGICPEDVDLYVDGADEVDPGLNLLKGGGGALFREKIAMLSSRGRIILVDESKLVEVIGLRRPVPLEVEIYAIRYVLRELGRMGLRAWERGSEAKLGPVISDNGNVIIDVETGPVQDPAEMDKKLRSIEGVVATGIFPYAGFHVIVGLPTGESRRLERTWWVGGGLEEKARGFRR